MNRLIALGCALAAIAGLSCAQAGPPSWAGRWLPDAVYAHHPDGDLTVDLYFPPSPPPPRGYPLIISFHGGGWIIGNKRMDIFLRPLVREGFVLACPQYRLSPRAKFPAQIEDARAAAHWLLDHSRSLHLDPDRVFAAGASAGGQLALLLALSGERRFLPDGTPPLPKNFIKGVAALYPVTDLYGIVPPGNQHENGNLIALLLGGSVEEKSALARAGSPINYVTPKSPPVFLFHGDQDGLVPLNQSENLHRKLRAAGVESRLVIRQGRMHGFGLTTPQAREVGAFFRRQMPR